VSNIGVTLKFGLGVVKDHWKWCPPFLSYLTFKISWPWNLG